MPRKQSSNVKASRNERLMSDAGIERLVSSSVEDLYRKEKLNRSDVERWVEQVKADSGRIYEPVYSPRRVRGTLGESLWLKRREELESEQFEPHTSRSHHATKKSPAQLQREIDEVLEGDPGMRCDRLVREVRELEALADAGRLGYRARGGRGSTTANELYHASLRALGLTKGALRRGDCTDAEVNLERAYRYFHKAEGLAGPTEPITSLTPEQRYLVKAAFRK